jgi:hypothetical protein
MRPMRRLLLHATLFSATLATSALGQMHKVAKPEQVVRAVGVYEWTGDFNKPTASRLIPVSLYIEGKFEDAGVYIARPIPFALLPGNVYILQTAGVDKGTLDLAYAKHLQAVESTGDLAYDDGWFGYGTVKPLAAPRRTTTQLKPSKTLSTITTASNDSTHPHLTTKPATTTDDSSKPAATTTGTTTTTASSDDSDRPTMKRRDSSGTSSTTPSADSTSTPSATPADDPDRPTLTRRNPASTPTDTTSTSSNTGTTPADDPDRPTLTRKSPTTTTDDPSSTASSGSPPSDDPDRPTLKRHSAEDAKHSSASGNTDSVSAVGDLNADPNRPNLHHGKPTSAMTEADLPRLTGLPSNLHQTVAVSDAVNRDPHPFTLAWDDEAQHQAILQKLQAMAQTQLAAYGHTPATAPPSSAAAVKKTAATTARTHKSATPPAQPLLDEELRAYTLSYGGAPTYIYTANTGGTGAALRYVTIVVQADGNGDLKPAIQNVTDAAHLDRTPRMQFVDVVDAEASNRASLLFELRSQNARQFALYRVIASHPEQIFLTGTTQ